MPTHSAVVGMAPGDLGVEDELRERLNGRLGGSVDEIACLSARKVHRRLAVEAFHVHARLGIEEKLGKSRTAVLRRDVQGYHS